MNKKLSRWLKSKTGRITLTALLSGLVILVVVGQLAGWWEVQGQTGTAGLPSASYPMPDGGYTCMPTCSEVDGKFLVIPDEGLRSFTSEKLVAWIAVPSDQTSFELSIFDGDSGLDNTGVPNRGKGNWDGTQSEATYTLYADPLEDGTGMTVVGSWAGNQTPMSNNAWWSTTVATAAEAKAPSGHYFYRLEVTQPAGGISGINAFKLRATGYLMLGKSNLVNASIGFVGSVVTKNDTLILYPQYVDANNTGPSTYDGDWQLYFYVPNDLQTLELWDGDFDRGGSGVDEADTDDPNTEGKPEWASEYAVPERAGGIGAPQDDSANVRLKRSPAVKYELIDPTGTPIYINEEPSGTEEWEYFMASTDASKNPDYVTTRIQPGMYNIHIMGLDLHNSVFFRMDYTILPKCGDGACPPPQVWLEGTCPRTIGYWKNNVKKVLIENRTKGVQESRETLEWALNNVALASPLFRSGLNPAAPGEIATVARLTDAEANTLLQRKGDNSMLARALQQNLATWLNLASGKLGPTTVIHLDLPSGPFDGTVWAALQEAQTYILTNTNLERAKDIADMINNGQLNVDPAEAIPCGDYEQLIPPSSQPPRYTEMPDAPPPATPVPPTQEPEPDPQTCEDVRTNIYGVENPTNNPFYGIKFEYQSGTEIRDGSWDIFTVILPQDVAAGMTTVNVEAKAADSAGQALLTCDFTSPVGCGDSVRDPDNFFAFYFLGAKDNGDGMLTLKFQVQNFVVHGLSHATIGLPDGVVPPSNGNYQSQVCP